MENDNRKGPRIVTMIGVIVILILVTQNFLLVRKVRQFERRIDLMGQEILRLSIMSPGDSVGPFMAFDRDSTTVLINPAAGETKTLMLVFTTWCPTCRKNMDLWDRLLNQLKGEHIRILALSSDSLYKIGQYTAERPISFPVYSVFNDTSVTLRYKLWGVPQTILINEGGKVIRVWPGLLLDEFRAAICDSIRGSALQSSKAAVQSTAINKTIHNQRSWQ